MRLRVLKFPDGNPFFAAEATLQAWAFPTVVKG